MRPLTRFSLARRAPKLKRLATRKARLHLDSLEERVVPSVSTIEDFSGDLSAYRTIYRYEPSAAIIPNAGHDGVANALLKQDGYEWMMREDGGSAVRQGDTIDVWTQFSGNVDGRIYFAFGAHPYGLVHSPYTTGHTLALVLAGNTGQMMFEANDVTSGQSQGLQPAPRLVGSPVAQSYDPDTWYQMEVVWGVGGALTGNLYDANGNLLNTVTATENVITSGGIGFRGFGSDKYFDTVTVDDGTSPMPHGGAVHGARAIHHAPAGLANFQTNTPPRAATGAGSDGTGTPVPWDYTSVPGSGRDIQLDAWNSIQQFARVGDVVALAGTNVSLNVGQNQVSWGPAFYSGSGDVAPETPLLGQYLFRQRPGEATTLIGSSDLKHFFSTVSGDFQNLNPGESDAYGSGLNASQAYFLPGSDLDPVSGEMHRPSGFSNVDANGDGFDIHFNSSFDQLIHRLQVNIEDLDPAQNPAGTRWFFMGNLWVAGDDNVDNNSRWVEITPSWNGSTFTFAYPHTATGQLNFRTIPGLVGGPSVVSSTPNGGVLPPVDTVTVTFDSAIDPTTFSPAQVHVFNGPNGAIPVNDVEPTDDSDTTFAITFDAQSSLGGYTMTIGPDIYDQNGNPMVSDYTINFTIVPAINLVVNGGFENGDTGWVDGNSVQTSGFDGIPAHSGTHFLALGAVGSDAATTQRVTTVAGQTYDLQFFYYSDGGTPSDLNVSWNGTVVYNEQNPAFHSWQQHDITVTGTGGDILSIAGRNDPTYDGIDDVSLSPGAAPGPGGGARVHLGLIGQAPLATALAATQTTQSAPLMIDPSTVVSKLASAQRMPNQDTEATVPAQPLQPDVALVPQNRVLAPDVQDSLLATLVNPVL